MKRPDALAIVAALLLAACHKDAPAPPPTKVYASEPVPAPDGLIADAAMRGPDALWGKVREGVGGPLARVPGSLGGALTAVAGLDLAAAAEVDGASPAFASAAQTGPSFGWLVALKLRDLAHARATLFEGQKPRFTKHEVGDGVLVVASGSTDAPTDYTLAVSPLGYLLIAHAEADVAALAPYTTRTLPAEPPSPHALVASVRHAALAGPINTQIAGAIHQARAAATALDADQRERHGGRAPDFGDPTALIQRLDDYAQGKLAIVADLARADLTLDAEDDDVKAELVLTPGTGASSRLLAGYATGDASPLLSLSADTEAAILVRDDPAAREGEMKSAEDTTLAVFKRKLGREDTGAVHTAFTSWGASRGDWITFAAELGGSPALLLRTPTTDPERAMGTVTRFVDLTQRPVFHEMLAARFAVQGVSSATVAAGSAGSTSLATFRRGKGAEPGGDAELAVAWATAGSILRVGAALSSARALRATKDPTELLGRDVALAGKLGMLHDRVAVVVVARPALGAEAGPSRPAAVFGAGKDKANGWAMLEVDDAMLRGVIGRWLDR